MNTILILINSIVLLGILVIRSKELLYLLQLEKYKFRPFVNYFFNHIKEAFIIVPLVLSLLQFVFIARFGDSTLILIIALLINGGYLPYVIRKDVKVKFRLTYRIKRLIGSSVVLTLVLYGITRILVSGFYSELELLLLSMTVTNFLIYDVICLAYLVNKPVERLIQQHFIKQAKQRLSDYQPDVIGITGSYGKTSTRAIVADLLKGRRFVCETPKSYNTPMGISITVNQKLRKIDDVFVCEMGATEEGDIKELVDIVKPNVGIITAIGPQHLESFGDIETIIKTKFELIEHLPEGGTAILNVDNRFIKNYSIKNNVNVIRYGIVEEKVDYRAIDVTYGSFGSRFTVVYPNGDMQEYETQLLGRHAIYNILAGLIIADLYKVSRKELKLLISQLKPVEHRLELKTFNTFSIIDDAFNSNVEGFSHAVEILGSFPGKKIIITPGIIDLGDKHYAMNHRLAKLMAPVCDFIVLVGKKQTEPIYDGLVECNYSLDNLFVTNDFKRGYQKVLEQFKENFTLLIENDLPDNYTED